MMRSGQLMILVACLLVAPALVADVRSASVEANAAAARKKAADAAVKDAQRTVSQLEKKIEALRDRLRKASQPVAVQPAPPGRDRKTMEARIAELTRNLPMLTSIINKLANDMPLSSAEQKLLTNTVGSSVPVKAEMLQNLQGLRDQWQRELGDLERDLAAAPPPPPPGSPGPLPPDLDALRAELEAAEKELAAAKSDLDRKRDAAAVAKEEAELAELKLEVARLREKRAKIEEKLRRKAEEAGRAAEKLDEERRAAASGSEAAQGMAKALGWTREVATKIGEFLGGDVGEALAEAATTQLEVGAKALQALPGLVPQVEGLTRNPDGTYTFNQSGQSLLLRLVDALNAFVKAQRQLDALLGEWKATTAKIDELDRRIGSR